MAKLKDLSMKQLSEMAVKLGMPEADIEAFNSKAQLIATINTLKKAAKKIDPSTSDKETPAERKKTDRRWLSKAMKMRDNLEKQPKVGFMLPLEPGEKAGVVEEKEVDGHIVQKYVSGAVESVTLNGFKTLIPKGQMVRIPQQVAEVLSRSMQMTMEAGKDFEINRPDPETGGKVKDQL